MQEVWGNIFVAGLLILAWPSLNKQRNKLGSRTTDVATTSLVPTSLWCMSRQAQSKLACFLVSCGIGSLLLIYQSSEINLPRNNSCDFSSPVLHDNEAEEGQVLLGVGPLHPLDLPVVHRFREIASSESDHSVAAFRVPENFCAILSRTLIAHQIRTS